MKLKKNHKAKIILSEKINKMINKNRFQKKPTFKKFLYNKFQPLTNMIQDSQDDFDKFNLDSSSSVLNKKQFTIIRNKNAGSLDISSYHDVLYKGAKDSLTGNTNNAIIENRVDNTFKFNCEKVIDSVLRSNKHRKEDNNLNDSFKYIGYSPPLRKVKNIFKNLRSQDSRDHSNSNSFINDEEKLNGKLFNKRRHSNYPSYNKINSILENTGISNNKKDNDVKNLHNKEYHNYFKNISNIHYEKKDNSNPSINVNINRRDSDSKVRNSTSYFKKSLKNNNNLNNSKLNGLNNSELNEDKDKSNFYIDNKLELKKSSAYNSLKSQVSFGSQNGINSFNEEYHSENESKNFNQNIQNKQNFIMKNIKLAKNYSRVNQKDNDEIHFKRNLKRKLHLLLNDNCQKFCEDLKLKNSNFNQKINNHLISQKYEDKLKDYHKNFHYRGMSYNPVRYTVNLESIEKNFLTPENVIKKKITPLELKIIQSDVNYYIKDKKLIKDNPVLKIKSLKDILKEEEEVEINNRNKKNSLKLSAEEEAKRKYQEKLKLIKSGSKIILIIIFRC